MRCFARSAPPAFRDRPRSTPQGKETNFARSTRTRWVDPRRAGAVPPPPFRLRSSAANPLSPPGEGTFLIDQHVGSEGWTSPRGVATPRATRFRSWRRRGGRSGKRVSLSPAAPGPPSGGRHRSRLALGDGGTLPWPGARAGCARRGASVSWEPDSSPRAPTGSADSRPDLVDLTEAGRRLGVTAQQIRAMMRSGRFPRPHYRFGLDGIWHWPHISGWGEWRGRGWFRTSGYRRHPQPPLPAVELVSLAQIADRLSIPTSVLTVLRTTQRFPAPDYRWHAGEAWHWETAQAWGREAVGTGSEPSRTIDVTRDPPTPVRIPSVRQRTSRERLERLNAVAARLAEMQRTTAASHERAGP